MENPNINKIKFKDIIKIIANIGIVFILWPFLFAMLIVAIITEDKYGS